MKINFSFVKGRILFFARIWYLNFFHGRINKGALDLRGRISLVDQSWVENMEGLLIFKVKFIVIKVYYSVFKMHNVIFNQVLIFLVLFVFSTFFYCGSDRGR